MKMVEVTWIDASCLQGWRSDSNIDSFDGIPVVTSIGFLQKETKEFINLTSHDADTGDRADIMSIPRSSIKKIRRLKRG